MSGNTWGGAGRSVGEHVHLRGVVLTVYHGAATRVLMI